MQHIELAEDVVGETFLLAAETWGVRGIPPNPTAWLYLVAKQKLIPQFRRRKLLEETVMPQLLTQAAEVEEGALPDFSEETIRDSQLRMLFAICTSVIADEAQIGLALRILCGFGIDEIASAFLTSKETINKRLFRAKEKVRRANVTMELPPEGELVRRLDRVLHVIYLLFNEGYYSRTQNQTLQKGLCLEAMRLGIMLSEYEQTNGPKTNALLALMCFHSSRFEARSGGRSGRGAQRVQTEPQSADPLLLYEQQDEARWDTALIRQGFAYLELALQGDELSTYHVEARIASWHCTKEDTPDKWVAILDLYDQLIKINPSPSVALNRTYALFKVRGREVALTAAKKLRLESNHLYWTLLGELNQEADPEQARAQFRQALALAKTPVDRQTIQQKLDRLR